MMTVGGELLFPDVSKGVGLTGFLSIHCNKITGHEHVDQGMTLYKPSNANPGSATGGAAADNAEAASTTTNTFLQIDAFKVENRRAHYDTVLMELEAGLHKKATGCDLKECETAYMAIYEIIKQVYLHDCVNFKLFDEKSRVPLRWQKRLQTRWSD